MNNKYNKNTNRKQSNSIGRPKKIILSTSNYMKDGAKEIGIVSGISINILNVGSQIYLGLQR